MFIIWSNGFTAVSLNTYNSVIKADDTEVDRMNNLSVTFTISLETLFANIFLSYSSSRTQIHKSICA